MSRFQVRIYSATWSPLRVIGTSVTSTSRPSRGILRFFSGIYSTAPFLFPSELSSVSGRGQSPAGWFVISKPQRTDTSGSAKWRLASIRVSGSGPLLSMLQVWQHRVVQVVRTGLDLKLDAMLSFTLRDVQSRSHARQGLAAPHGGRCRGATRSSPEMRWRRARRRTGPTVTTACSGRPNRSSAWGRSGKRMPAHPSSRASGGRRRDQAGGQERRRSAMRVVSCSRSHRPAAVKMLRIGVDLVCSYPGPGCPASLP